MTWLTWPLRLLGFALWYGKEVIRTNVTVIRDNLTRGQHSTPGIAQVPTRCTREFEVMLLGSLITLTPGTLTLGASLDDTGAWQLTVHSLYNSDPEELRTALADMERRMLSSIRRTGAAE